MKILNQVITIDELRTMAAQTFGDMIKAVVDVEIETVNKWVKR